MFLDLVLETNEYYSKFGSAVELMTATHMLLLSVLLTLNNWGKELEEVDDGSWGSFCGFVFSWTLGWFWMIGCDESFFCRWLELYKSN